MIFQPVTLPDGVYFPARPVFDALRANNYSQWARVGGVVKIAIPTSVGEAVTDLLPALELYRVVFGSRSANALAVQSNLLEQSLLGLGSVSKTKAQPRPIAAQQALPQPQTVPPPTLEAQQQTLKLDPRAETILNALQAKHPSGVLFARANLANCMAKYDMPATAWINYQWDQIAPFASEESIVDMPEFASLKADRDNDVNWERLRTKL